MPPTIPIIDILPLLADEDPQSVAAQIHDACTNTGFFYLAGHGIDEVLQQRLENLSNTFFALEEKDKMQYRMELGGNAWRGYFPIEGELTSGKPDLKEGLYFGEELGSEDHRVKAGQAMHGRNLFPAEIPEFKAVILKYLSMMTSLGHHLMRGISLSLGMPEDYICKHYTTDPLILFRIFHYPPQQKPAGAQWGVGEHTDYGLLTILKQDEVGGLQVKSKKGWIEAPFIPNTFICNVGDMLDRLTRGYYKSTPHRVINTSGRDRYSFPFFFDPNFEARLDPLPIEVEHFSDDAKERWDKESVHTFQGTYGEYITGKVGKVFPLLKEGKTRPFRKEH